MSAELRARAISAVAGYRETGDREYLALLCQDGERQLAHALTMERVLSGAAREPWTAQVDAWLAGTTP